MKFFRKTTLGRIILAWLFHKYCLLTYYTNHKKFIGRKKFLKRIKSRKPIIFIFWHGRMVFVPFMDEEKEKNYVLISHHSDGILIAKSMDFSGVKQIRGSSDRLKSKETGAKNRGGKKAIRECLKILKNGGNISITPDGPRGPRMNLKTSVINIASIAGADIIPVTFSSSRCKIFKSWDRFMLPLPFGKTVCIYGAPISIPENISKKELENTRKYIENQLNSLTREADLQVGINPVKPASS